MQFGKSLKKLGGEKSLPGGEGVIGGDDGLSRVSEGCQETRE